MKMQLMLKAKLLLIFLLFSQSTFSAPVPWPEVSFTYIARQQTLVDALGTFARNFGIDFQPSAAVRGREEKVNGKFTLANPTEFLNQLSSAYGLQWFYHGGCLYVSKNFETATKAISPNGLSLPEFKKALIDLGIVEAKFGWGELSDRGVVMVSGPPSYVELVAWSVSNLPLPQAPQQIRIFRLTHAQVNDRVISYRDQQITTDGVASILRNLVTGYGGGGGTRLTNLQQLSSIAAPLRQISPVPGNEEQTSAASTAASKAQSAASENVRQAPALRPVIQADSRLNAVIVKDISQHMPIYEELIKLLDVPTRLIEIEAMIVDVNSSNVADLGIDWGARSGGVAGGFGRPSTAPDDVTGTIVFGSNVNPTTVIPNAGNFLMARIRLLEGKGGARVVSRPSVLTVDNLGALIDLSDTFYVQSVGERVANVVPISVGTTLKVTPHIIDTPSGSAVHLIVDIEDGVIQDISPQSLPRVRRSTIGTQAVMNEREALLIGGFNSESDIRQLDQIPSIGNMPIFGFLFKKKSTKVEKRERLFLITPKIISAGSDVNAVVR